MKSRSKLSKKQLFQLSFLGIIFILFIIRMCSASGGSKRAKAKRHGDTDSVEMLLDSALGKPFSVRSALGKAHPIRGVSSYDAAFPDLNDTQLASAQRFGIKPQQSRAGLEALYATKIVRIDSCPYYSVDRLNSSVPYLVPRAQKLLAVAGRNFIDSLMWKHLPPAQVIVTSVLRTKDDVGLLQSTNINSTANSCHFYGTTFDLSYTRYRPLSTPSGQQLRLVRDDTLKWVLSEVLSDLRQMGLCHVKHEKKQGCFHITVR